MKTLKDIAQSRFYREKTLEYLGMIPESILKHNRSDRPTDPKLVADGSVVKTKTEAVAKRLLHRIDPTQVKHFDLFRTSSTGCRGKEGILSTFSQNICRFMVKFYTEDGDTVYDPFAGHNCLPANTRIVTENGSKNIENIKIGDFVLTHKGRYKEVIHTFNHSCGNVDDIKFKIAGNPELIITGRHPVLVIDIKKGGPEFIKSKDLDVGNFVCFPIIKDVKDIESIFLTDFYDFGSKIRVLTKGHYQVRKSKKVYIKPYSFLKNVFNYFVDGNFVVSNNISKTGERKRVFNKIFIDEDFLRLCGYYVAEGGGSAGGYGLTFTFGRDEKEYAEDVIFLLKKCLNLSPDKVFYGSDTDKTIRITTTSTILFKLFSFLFGRKPEGKKVPDFFVTLPISKQIGFVKGYFRGDGHVGIKIDNRVAVTVSPTLAVQLKQIFFRMGLLPSIHVYKITDENQKDKIVKKCKWNIISKHDIYRIQFTGDDITKFDSIFGIKNDKLHKKKFNSFFFNGYACYKILKKDFVNLTNEPVYNFEVEEDHSYVSFQTCLMNSRMEAVWNTGRNYYGSDLSHNFMEFNRELRLFLLGKKEEELFSTNNCDIVLNEGDSRHVPWPNDFADFSITSPPYWDLEYYGDEEGQLGYRGNKAIPYEEFLEGLGDVLAENKRMLKPGAFCAWNVNDFRKGGRFYDYHTDVILLGRKAGFDLHDMIIFDYGTPVAQAFLTQMMSRKVMAKRHEYCIVWRKPGGPSLIGVSTTEIANRLRKEMADKIDAGEITEKDIEMILEE